MAKEGFWVKFGMESGRGHSIIKEKYEFYKYKDGFTEKDIKVFEDDAYNWAGYDMGGFQMMRFESSFEVVERPSTEWLHKEYDILTNKIEEMKKMRSLIADEIMPEKGT